MSSEKGIDSLRAEYQVVVGELRKFVREGATRSLDFRRAELGKMIDMVTQNFDRMGDEVLKDLGGGPNMRKVSLGGPLHDARTAQKKLAKWAAPEKISHKALSSFFPGSTKVLSEPKGVVLVIAPWNFPLNLSLSPIISALAAGNAVVLKPSEIAPGTAALLQELIERYLDPRWVRVVQGGVPEATALLQVEWDHIMYTGNETVGKIVMRAAAEYLTPLTLELGGKCPCVVDVSAKLESSADRIVGGKYFNNGQVCAAPDYVLVDERVASEFIEILKKKYERFYTEAQAKTGHEYHGRCINSQHSKRVQKLLDNLSGDAEILVQGYVVGGVEDGYVRPTVVLNPGFEDPIMKEEIFGPVLAVRTYSGMKDCVNQINTICSSPLCLYIFSEEQSFIRSLVKATRSGQVVINGTIDAVLVNEHFGGVGTSGFGAYHGKAGFDEFSYKRPLIKVDNKIVSTGPLEVPPIGGFSEKVYRVARAYTLNTGFTAVRRIVKEILSSQAA